MENKFSLQVYLVSILSQKSNPVGSGGSASIFIFLEISNIIRQDSNLSPDADQTFLNFKASKSGDLGLQEMAICSGNIENGVWFSVQVFTG